MNRDFEAISRQVSASVDDGSPVVIPWGSWGSGKGQSVERSGRDEGKDTTGAATGMEKATKKRWWEMVPPSGVTEELVHMAFAVS